MSTMYAPNPLITHSSASTQSCANSFQTNLPQTDLSQNKQSQQPLAQQYQQNEHWHQPFLLFAEMIIARADTLQLIMQEQTQKLLSSRKLGTLLHWATQVTHHSEDDLDACAKRAEALSLAIHRGSQLALGRARGHYRTLGTDCASDLEAAAQYAHAIASKLDANITQGEQQTVGRTFIDRVVATWYSGEFDSSILDLTKTETQSLRNFLYVNYLIVQCHALTATVSTEAWHTIQSRMLQVNYED
jgi:hypothetical protein